MRRLVWGMIWISLGLMACQNQSQEAVVIPTLASLPSATFTPSNTPPPTPTLTFTPSRTPTDEPLPTLTPSRTPTSTFSPTPSPTVQSASTTISGPQGPQLFEELAAQVDPLMMIRTIQEVVAFGNRYTNSEVSDQSGIYAARTYLRGRMETVTANCGGRASFYQDDFSILYQSLPSTQANLVLYIQGSEADLPAVVVGAHYDTMSKEDRNDPDFGIQPGADDNGSGISAVLELARLICLTPRQQSMIFVLFAAEEIRTETQAGRVGSTHFITSFVPQQRWSIAAMLNLDTIGSATDVNGTIIDDLALIYSAPPVDGPSRQLARQMQASAYVHLPEFRVQLEPREDRQNRWGDHMSFTRAGYPAARLFEGSEDTERQDSARDLINDIDPDYLANNLLVTLAYLLGQSEGPLPPLDVSLQGNQVILNPDTALSGYLVAYRLPDESNYTYQRLAVGQYTALIPSGYLVAVGSIGANGLLGPLSAEQWVP